MSNTSKSYKSGHEVNSRKALHESENNRVALWPPNHKMVAITIKNVNDPENIKITKILQDEPINEQGDGDESRHLGLIIYYLFFSTINNRRRRTVI